MPRIEALDLGRLAARMDEYFEPKLAEHGPTARGADWNSPEAQERRFDELLRICPRGEGFSLVDYGCGYGALLPYMRERGYEVDYTGFDVSERMVAHARELEPAARFTTDPGALDAVDFVVASGLFNLRFDVGDEPWRDYVVATLESIDGLATRGFAFNMLTSYSDPEKMRPDLYYGDPCFFFDLCKRRFSPSVALLHDYGLYEFTMLVRR